jgi:hypothetical protein
MTIYINFDVETTGPVPGLHSMLSFGAVAHRDSDWREVDYYSINIQEMEDAGWDVDTRRWWASPERLDAWTKTTAAPRFSPLLAMERVCVFLEALRRDFPDDGRLIFVAYPITFDFAFLNYYMHRFCPNRWRALMFNKHIGWSGMDIQTLAMCTTGKSFGGAVKKNWPKDWTTEDYPHTHVAVEDARGQAYSFKRMMESLRLMQAEATREP